MRTQGRLYSNRVMHATEPSELVLTLNCLSFVAMLTSPTIQPGFNVHIQSKLLSHTPVMGTVGAGRSSEVERPLMVRWVVGSIFHGVDPLSYFSFQPVLHDWFYPVCGMVNTKEPLLLIDKSSLCGCSGFPFSLSKWSLTICLTPYCRR